MRSVGVKDDGTAVGRYRLYISDDQSSQGGYYTGLGFGSLREAQTVARYLNKALGCWRDP